VELLLRTLSSQVLPPPEMLRIQANPSIAAHFFFINFSSFIFLTYHKYNIFGVVFPAFSKYKFVVVEEKIYGQQEVFLIEERSYPHLLLHRSAGPALPQPVDNL
jgi:hypothetical protein